MSESESESSESESSDSYWDNEISNRNYKRQLCITMLFDDLIFGTLFDTSNGYDFFIDFCGSISNIH